MKIPRVLQKYMHRDLLNIANNPLCITKNLLFEAFTSVADFSKNCCYEDSVFEVSIKENFDDLLFGQRHPARLLSESYYTSDRTLLRTHLTSRDGYYLQQGISRFLNVGKVFRRDEIDRSHLPIFHQFEGVFLYHESELPDQREEFVLHQLQTVVDSVFTTLFKDHDIAFKWTPSSFPFTNPSVEAEMLYNGKWLEMLGAGVLKDEVLLNMRRTSGTGYAFGMGLERLAMTLFDIPDIRWFWSEDDRFCRQFEPGKVTKFVPFSIHPSVIRDISFWLPQDSANIGNFVYDLMRDVAGNDLESVKRVLAFNNA
jgi:phenylalanyl-tRNA synthetase alpha chain